MAAGKLNVFKAHRRKRENKNYYYYNSDCGCSSCPYYLFLLSLNITFMLMSDLVHTDSDFIFPPDVAVNALFFLPRLLPFPPSAAPPDPQQTCSEHRALQEATVQYHHLLTGKQVKKIAHDRKLLLLFFFFLPHCFPVFYISGHVIVYY